MTILLENPVPIFAVGAVLATLCGLALLTRRNLPSLLAFTGVVGATLLLVLVERLVVTDREEVEAAVADLLKAIEENDLPTVLAAIDPAAAEVRDDAETLMPMVKVEDTGATSLRVEVDATAEPQTAVAKFRGKINGIHRNSGQRVFYFEEVHLFWVKRERQWLVVDYQVHTGSMSIDAVDDLRQRIPRELEIR